MACDTDKLADAIVADAVAAHPGDGVAIARHALALVDRILGPGPVWSGRMGPHGDDDSDGDQAALEFAAIESGDL